MRHIKSPVAQGTATHQKPKRKHTLRMFGDVLNLPCPEVESAHKKAKKPIPREIINSYIARQLSYDDENVVPATAPHVAAIDIAVADAETHLEPVDVINSGIRNISLI